MPLYHYDSFSKRGTKVSGTIDAPSPQAAKDMLQGQGLMPTKIVETTESAKVSFVTKLFEKKVDTKTVILFTRQLAVLLKSAVPLVNAMELLVEQFEDPFRRILISVKDSLKAGEPLAQTLSKYPKVFINVYIQLVRAGEASGKLDTILFSLTGYLEKTEETRKKIKKAMTYPIIMISFAILVVVGMMVGLVPRIKGIFEKMKMEMPGPTQLLISMSNFFVNNFTLMAVTTIAFIMGFLYWKSTPKGKYILDEIFLRIPLTMYFSRTKAVVQFSSTLGMLLESGVNLTEALDIVCNIVDNKVLVKRLSTARDKIIKEGKIARYLKETEIFPGIASYMISTGEQSGKLAEMLTTVGNDYNTELNDITEGLTGAITPIMTLLLGGIVTFIVLAIFLPIMNMSSMMSGM
jgi:type II secretory pathway component PulF